MAEAKITITLTPAEFDLVRSELQARIDAHQEYVRAEMGEPRDRSKARELGMRLTSFLERLK